MSFNWNVQGLHFDPYKSSLPSQYVPIMGLGRSQSYTCPDYHGNPYPCEKGDDGVSTFSINLLDTGYDETADYYHVVIHIDGPETISPGGCHEQVGPTDTPPCGSVGGDFPVYDGTISPGDWLRQVIDQSGPPPWNNSHQEIAPNTFNAIGISDTNWRAFTYWPDRTDLPGEQRSWQAYLVNPTPVWPVPDTYGNTFGNCLFTADQLPESIDLELIHHNREQTRPGRLWAFVRAYTSEDPGSGGGGQYYSSIIGYS